MSDFICRITFLFLAASVAAPALAGPQEDLKEFQAFFENRFPDVSMAEFGNGAYAIDENMRENWLATEEFPPYEPMVDEGREAWNRPFANGNTYADCFDGTPGVVQYYPYYDIDKKMVITLPLAINECRAKNGEPALPYGKGEITHVMAYMAFESRGELTDVVSPTCDPNALAAYEAGKEYWYKRQGQFQFSCAHCHKTYAGSKLRTDVLSPGMGHTTHWPVYRADWGEMGTLHRRFSGCLEMVRGRVRDEQSETFRNLEYFLTYMSNGVPLNGPGYRK